MTIHNIVSLNDTTPVRLSPANTHSGTDITIQNINNSGYIYIGGENVSIESFGFRLAHNQAISFELNGRDSLYAVSSGSDMVAAVIMVSLESGE